MATIIHDIPEMSTIKLCQIVSFLHIAIIGSTVLAEPAQRGSHFLEFTLAAHLDTGFHSVTLFLEDTAG